MDDKIKAGLAVTVIALLVGAGYTITDKTYYCPAGELTMECNRISSTGHTCYPNVGDNKGSKYCSDEWIKLSGYVPDDEAIFPEPVINPGVGMKACCCANPSKVVYIPMEQECTDAICK